MKLAIVQKVIMEKNGMLLILSAMTDVISLMVKSGMDLLASVSILTMVLVKHGMLSLMLVHAQQTKNNGITTIMRIMAVPISVVL
jgi:hypothetical protein